MESESKERNETAMHGWLTAKAATKIQIFARWIRTNRKPNGAVRKKETPKRGIRKRRIRKKAGLARHTVRVGQGGWEAEWCRIHPRAANSFDQVCEKCE